MKQLLVLLVLAGFLTAPGPIQSAPAETAGEIPALIISPSCVGEVKFPHQMHFDDMGVPCQDCHHEVNATKLDMPHSDYFDDFWIDCSACHSESGTPSTSQACSACHHSDPAGIADETLSSKVVIHKSCWTCHETGTGDEASESCGTCHQGARTCP
ncbi:MAG: cytochrome c3 family protein [Thermoanaerobaculia bacterium]